MSTCPAELAARLARHQLGRVVQDGTGTTTEPDLLVVTDPGARFRFLASRRTIADPHIELLAAADRLHHLAMAGYVDADTVRAAARPLWTLAGSSRKQSSTALSLIAAAAVRSIPEPASIRMVLDRRTHSPGTDRLGADVAGVA